MKPTDAELIKQARKLLGLNQSEFAKKAGFADQSYISKIERGQKRLSVRSRKLIEMLRSKEVES